MGAAARARRGGPLARRPRMNGGLGGHTRRWLFGDIHKVCFWCGKTLHEGHPDCPVTTHGICWRCEKKLAEEIPPEGCWICDMCSGIITDPGKRVCEECNDHWGPFEPLNTGDTT